MPALARDLRRPGRTPACGRECPDARGSIVVACGREPRPRGEIIQQGWCATVGGRRAVVPAGTPRRMTPPPGEAPVVTRVLDTFPTAFPPGGPNQTPRVGPRDQQHVWQRPAPAGSAGARHASHEFSGAATAGDYMRIDADALEIASAAGATRTNWNYVLKWHPQPAIDLTSGGGLAFAFTVETDGALGEGLGFEVVVHSPDGYSEGTRTIAAAGTYALPFHDLSGTADLARVDRVAVRLYPKGGLQGCLAGSLENTMPAALSDARDCAHYCRWAETDGDCSVPRCIALCKVFYGFAPAPVPGPGVRFRVMEIAVVAPP